MRYFLYVSATKVNMLHGQIRRSLLSRIKGSLSIKALFAEAKIEAETAERDLFNKAEEVRNHILLRERAGTIDKPSFYIDDTANLRMGNVFEDEASMGSIAFFGEVISGKKFALLGSSSSLVGTAVSVEANHAPIFYTMKFVQEVLGSNLTKPIRSPRYLPEAVDVALAETPGPAARLSFTAITLHDTPELLVATPIFVSREQ